MNNLRLQINSFGMGDRFAHQAEAQLKAIQLANENGVKITPVWNKSYREHKTIGSKPLETRIAVDKAVQNANWQEGYFVDADHITVKTVDQFLPYSDFFTIDVADFIGRPCSEDIINEFIDSNKKYLGKLELPGIREIFTVTEKLLTKIGKQYLFAISEASTLYNHIKDNKPDENPVIEISMDETNAAQTPIEIFFILSAIAKYSIPLNTIAPKFSGRFNKGIDYAGDLEQFAKEFEEDILVLKYAVSEFNFPHMIKLSVHSGSDKFSIYSIINKIIKKHHAGLHVKTAGTTWLEELIGLMLAGSEGLEVAKQIYSKSLDRFDELTFPYATVIDINKNQLPSKQVVNNWSGEEFVAALKHNLSSEKYNPSIRQLLHIGYKIAAEMGPKYINTLEKYESIISKNVTENLFSRHIKPIFF